MRLCTGDRSPKKNALIAHFKSTQAAPGKGEPTLKIKAHQLRNMAQALGLER